MSSESANNIPTVCTDDEVQELWESVNNPHEMPRRQKLVRRVIERLRVAEKVLPLADDVLGAIFDPYKNDCSICDAHLTPCKDWCDNEALFKALEAWRKTVGKAK